MIGRDEGNRLSWHQRDQVEIKESCSVLVTTLRNIPVS